MLAAAPPKAADRRMRTSTNTSVVPSRAMRSISPRRVRKLRATITRPRATKNAAASDSARAPASARRGVERYEAPVTIYGEPAFADYKDMSPIDREEKAKALLNEAGFGPGKPLKVEIRYNTSDNNKNTVVAIAKTILRGKTLATIARDGRLTGGRVLISAAAGPTPRP